MYLLFLIVAVVYCGSVQLTADSFESTIQGKNAFVKFQSPWCGHCKAMKAAWEELGDEFAGSSSLVIGDVDCTAHASLCEKFGIQGYPTVKYWKDGQINDYNGGRDIETLKKHVLDNLASPCLVADTSACSEREIDFIAKNKDLPKDKVAAQLQRLVGMASAKVKPSLKQWISQRVNILKQLAE